MSAERVTYVDSSAVLKLIVREAESAALAGFLRPRRMLVSSVLCRVEVLRACLGLGRAVFDRAREVLARIDLIRINDRVVEQASTLLQQEVRSLDALHLATALLLGPSLEAIVTYDDRMARAARALSKRVVAPRP